MFGLGWQEIMIILVITVLVIGPEQLPQVARTLGKLIAQFRRVTNDLRDTVNREFAEREEFKEFQEMTRSLDSEVREIGYTAQSYVEKEVAREEAELKELAKEVAGEEAELKRLGQEIANADPDPQADAQPHVPVASSWPIATASHAPASDVPSQARTPPDGNDQAGEDEPHPARKKMA